MAHEAVRIQGKVMLEVFTADHKLVARSEGRNTVVDGGRRLLARLLSGEASNPTFSIVAGIIDKETALDQTKLYDMDSLEPIEVKELKTNEGDIILAGSFPPADKERLICEAGLMLACKTNDADEHTLYNRVLITPPQIVRMEQVLSLTWTLQFAQKG